MVRYNIKLLRAKLIRLSAHVCPPKIYDTSVQSWPEAIDEQWFDERFLTAPTAKNISLSRPDHGSLVNLNTLTAASHPPTMTVGGLITPGNSFTRRQFASSTVNDRNSPSAATSSTFPGVPQAREIIDLTGEGTKFSTHVVIDLTGSDDEEQKTSERPAYQRTMTPQSIGDAVEERLQPGTQDGDCEDDWNDDLDNQFITRYVVFDAVGWVFREVGTKDRAMKQCEQRMPPIRAGNGVLLFVNDPAHAFTRRAMVHKARIDLAVFGSPISSSLGLERQKMKAWKEDQFATPNDETDTQHKFSPLWYVLKDKVKTLRQMERYRMRVAAADAGMADEAEQSRQSMSEEDRAWLEFRDDEMSE